MVYFRSFTAALIFVSVGFLAIGGFWVITKKREPATVSSGNSFDFIDTTIDTTEYPDLVAEIELSPEQLQEQDDMEFVMKLAASGRCFNKLRGFPPVGEDVCVAYFGGAYYTVSWGKHDFGRGFLKADTAMSVAFLYHFIFYC